MIGTDLLLEVPVQKEVREQLRRMAEDYLSRERLLPPVSMEELENLASAIIRENGFEEKYRAFIMVCCGNAIWQPVVRSIPFNKRILLLPQCLKNSTRCRAQEDELGLLCASCGNCNISGLLDMAEELGYVTVVSEGTTISSKIIESGRADAVIGVGCMEVLQKMHESVNKFSVPGIGIPLLQAGCKDTSADIDWIKEEIVQYNENTAFKLLNLNYLRNKVDKLFREEQLAPLLNITGNTMNQLVLESLLSGGKRIRPLLTVLAYEVFSKEISESNLLRLALAIECFHKASLVHDDIEDEDSTRNGKLTLHTRYGVPIAINTGDLLIGEGYRLIAETELDAGVISKCIAAVAQGHSLISTGQGMELLALRNREVLSLEETLRIFQYKSATAFRVSLLLGAIAGGADGSSIAQLEEFSHLIGIAYQIKDDLEDYQDPDGIPDLHKQSIMQALLAGAVTTDDRSSFRNAYAAGDIQTIMQLINGYGIQQRANDLLKEYISQTMHCLRSISHPGLKLALHEIMGKIFRDHF